MVKFIYKMQSLLNIKEKLEEQEKTAYGLARAALNEEEEKLDHLVARKNRYVEEKRQKMSELLDVLELTKLEQAIHSTELLISDQILAVKRAEKAVALAQIRLENAMKERKIQEKLKENAFEEFKKEIEAAEQQEINELVTYRFGNGKEREG